jgi:hypothetical protein
VGLGLIRLYFPDIPGNDPGRTFLRSKTMKPDRPLWGLLQRQPCWVPTWRGGLALLLIGVSLFILTVLQAYPFLAIIEPVTGGALVVEGWSPDYVLEAAMKEFKQHPYTKLYVTGGPLERGAMLSEYKTYAELAAASLLRMGLAAEAVQAVPAPEVYRDRTYRSAIVLRHWLHQHQLTITNFTVFTLGAHSRRTRLLFQKAMDQGSTVGIVAVPDQQYDGDHWWASSEGVRTVIGEAIAYTYVRWFFYPPKNP